MANVVRVIETKEKMYKAAYSIWIHYTDGYRQHTTRYTSAYENQDDAVNEALAAAENQSAGVASSDVAKTVKTMKLYAGSSYVYSIQYSDYGKKIRYKKKFTINRYEINGLHKDKTFYTPWLPSVAACDKYANDFRRKNGVCPEDDRLQKFPGAKTKSIKFTKPK